MAWVTISLRKQALKARIDYLNYKDLQLSQELQSMQMSAGYAKSMLSSQKNLELMQLQESYANKIDPNKEGSLFSDANTKDKSMSQLYGLYTSALQAQQIAEMGINSKYQTAEESQLRIINAKETAITQEKETIEAQLKAVAGEYDALEKALETDVKRDTVKLA